MLENMPVKSLSFDDLTIEGYSRAAVQTYWRIPELKIGFDLGAQPWSFMGTPTWFVSHTHIDHIVALPVYVARRRMMKMEPPTIYLPEHAIEPIERILRHVQPAGPRPAALRADADRAGRRDRAVARDVVVTVGDHAHTVPSLGFVVWERRRKLKPEYQGLAGDEIRDLRLAGTEVTDEVRDRRGWPTWATARRPGSTPARRCTRPRC